MEMKCKPSSHENPKAEIEESIRFDKSLQELKELRSQLHNAADHCETTFLEAEQKKDVLENTKEYICRAVVTVIDHLGNVSANLECLLSQENEFTDAELRINGLKQRFLSCEQYAHQLALTKMRWSENFPRFHSRYLSSLPTLKRSSKEKQRDSENQSPSKIIDKHILGTEEDLPLFMYTHKPSLSKNSMSRSAKVDGQTNLAFVLPVRDGLPVLTKVPNPTFHFQGTPRVGRHRKSLYGSDILSLIRRTKRT
ncbi:hypothetical protein L6164_005253 [Bauhinia variegata]|uniref:Uncharacterized protein n=1 Tax=Bauhinia variegata TaxID=167791 RepID=A0ACB9PS46_BAUVA|nr:hypothetical protein L6164_005253 [Bauhinia variegata]